MILLVREYNELSVPGVVLHRCPSIQTHYYSLIIYIIQLAGGVCNFNLTHY